MPSRDRARRSDCRCQVRALLPCWVLIRVDSQKGELHSNGTQICSTSPHCLGVSLHRTLVHCVRNLMSQKSYVPSRQTRTSLLQGERTATRNLSALGWNGDGMQCYWILQQEEGEKITVTISITHCCFVIEMACEMYKSSYKVVVGCFRSSLR